ncbi:MAG: glycosyltransferase family 4 protein, partial [Synergistaceae bacterium]|nr:glycosyltransferase family 4 protein [Synergistaceae bacterium]
QEPRAKSVHFAFTFLNTHAGMGTYETELAERLIKYEDLNISSLYFSLLSKGHQFVNFPVKHVRLPKGFVFDRFNDKFSRGIFRVFRNIFRKCVSYNILSKSFSDDDVYVFFENDLPRMRLKGKILAVIHDIIPLRVKEYSSMYELCLKNSNDILSRASRIITVSEFSRKDIADFFGIDKNRIDVVYNGVDVEEFSCLNTSKTVMEQLRIKYLLPEKYILYFGGSDPRKNVEAVINAYSILPDELQKIYKLVITNPSQKVMDLALEKGITSNVHFIRNIPSEDKPGIYQMAACFLWLSFYEGFGLPLVEAQASGVPVVCSNVTSMPEVVGDSALLVSPYDIRAISSKIEEILIDKELRENLIAKGYENIKRFSWDESAKKLHDIIINL